MLIFAASQQPVYSVCVW